MRLPAAGADEDAASPPDFGNGIGYKLIAASFIINPVLLFFKGDDCGRRMLGFSD